MVLSENFSAGMVNSQDRREGVAWGRGKRGETGEKAEKGKMGNGKGNKW
jgi:hypothetical protein